MNRIFIAVVFLALPLFLAGHSAALPDGTDETLRLKASEACLAAEIETDFGGLIEIPPRVRDVIAGYREAWREFCSQAGSGKGGTVYPLYRGAKEIEKEFSSVFAEADSMVTAVEAKEGWKESFNKAQEIHSMLQDRYPTFIPLFEGSYIEYNYFKADLGDFRELAPFGDAEDALFFREYFGLRGESLLHPWYRQTWDYGGCLRFGEYQWVAALKKIDFLKRNLSRPLYMDMAVEFEGKLKAVLEGLYGDGYRKDICTCGEKGAVERDLRAVLNHIGASPGYDKTADAAEKALKGIQDNTIRLNSEAQQHCSGG